jgi:hypothetical protein
VGLAPESELLTAPKQEDGGKGFAAQLNHCGLLLPEL